MYVGVATRSASYFLRSLGSSIRTAAPTRPRSPPRLFFFSRPSLWRPRMRAIARYFRCPINALNLKYVVCAHGFLVLRREKIQHT